MQASNPERQMRSNMKFIYVMDKAAKKMLEKKGYVLLKEDKVNSIWVFENREETMFDLGLDCQYVLSDTLTF